MRRWLQSFHIAGLVLAAGACSGASGGAGGSSSSAQVTTSSSSSSTTTSSSAADPKAAAQAGLDAYWSMVKRLLAAPDPSDPEVAERAIDPSLSAIRDELTTRQANGQVEQYEGATYHVDTTVSSVSGDSASFAGCVVDGARLVDSATGQVLNDKVSTSRISGTLMHVEGVWKMRRFDVLKKVDGEVACAGLV
jgi:hypothetical protein